MVDTQGGAFPRGQKVNELTMAATISLDLGKHPSQIFALTVTGACAITLLGAPIGYSEIKFILTNPGAGLSFTNAIHEAGGTEPTYTNPGVDILTLAVHCTAIGAGGVITGTVYQKQIVQDVKD